MMLFWSLDLAESTHDPATKDPATKWLTLLGEKFSRRVGWDWATRYGDSKCAECGVPLYPGEFCYFLGSREFENEDEDEHDVSLWCCLDCTWLETTTREAMTLAELSVLLSPPEILIDPERNPWLKIR